MGGEEGGNVKEQSLETEALAWPVLNVGYRGLLYDSQPITPLLLYRTC